MDKMKLETQQLLEENAALNNRTSQLVLQNTRLTDELLHLSDQLKVFTTIVEENCQLKENAAKLALEKSTSDFKYNQTLTRLDKLDNEHQQCRELKKGLENKTLQMSLEINNLHANISRLERDAKAHQTHDEELRTLLPLMVEHYRQVNETEEKDKEIVGLKTSIANMTRTIASFEQRESLWVGQIRNVSNDCKLAQSEVEAIRSQCNEQRQRLANVTNEKNMEKATLTQTIVNLKQNLTQSKFELKNAIAKLSEEINNTRNACETKLKQSQSQYEATCFCLQDELNKQVNVSSLRDIEIDNYKIELTN